MFCCCFFESAMCFFAFLRVQCFFVFLVVQCTEIFISRQSLDQQLSCRAQRGRCSFSLLQSRSIFCLMSTMEKMSTSNLSPVCFSFVHLASKHQREKAGSANFIDNSVFLDSESLTWKCLEKIICLPLLSDAA